MTKWVALALGALLSLGGAVSIWNGVDVIQSERGWVGVIAGSVTLTGGIVTFALFLLIREVQALRASVSASARMAPVPPPPPRAVPVVAPVIADEAAPVAPVLQEPVAAVVSAPVDSAPAAPPVVETASREPPAPQAPPHESLAFEQVFPPVPVPPTPVAPPSERFRFRSADAAIGVAAGAAAIGMFARSRAGSSTPEAPSAESQFPAEPAPQPQTEAQAEHVPSPESVLELLEEALQEPLPEAASQAVSTETATHAEAATGEPKAEAGAPASEETVVSPGYAWLERALGRDEGRKSPALDWLRSRPPTELLIDPAATALGVPAEPPVAEPEASPALAEPVEKAAAETGATVETAPVDEAAAVQEQAEQAPEPAAEPGVLGRYSSGGSDYTLYSDGSIDAQTEQGLFHFASMAELRAHIEAQNEQS